jgi:hypothetical protein
MLNARNFRVVKSFIRKLQEPLHVITQKWRQDYSYAYWSLNYIPTELWIGIRALTTESTDSNLSTLDVYICFIPAIVIRMHFQDNLDLPK